jgi:hypothetical protein
MIQAALEKTGERRRRNQRPRCPVDATRARTWFPRRGKNLSGRPGGTPHRPSTDRQLGRFRWSCPDGRPRRWPQSNIDQ